MRKSLHKYTICWLTLQFKVDNCGIDREKRQLSTILHMNQRPGRIYTTKKAPHLRCFHYSAIQLPTAISIWEFFEFPKQMTCSPQQQDIVVAHFTVTEVKLVFPHIACYPRSNLGGNAQQKSTSYEMLVLFSNSTASRNFLMEILRISCFTVWKHTASRGWILGKLYPPRTS